MVDATVLGRAAIWREKKEDGARDRSVKHPPKARTPDALAQLKRDQARGFEIMQGKLEAAGAR